MPSDESNKGKFTGLPDESILPIMCELIFIENYSRSEGIDRRPRFSVLYTIKVGFHYPILVQCNITFFFLLFSQLYEIGHEPGRKDFLDDLFTFMQKRGALHLQTRYHSVCHSVHVWLVFQCPMKLTLD